ncbi:MAG: hypothetical protein NWR72_14605 [Bacteroidia bacterium]|nr:hypothetical protein [Bacteroidia bacterium]
MNTWSSFQQALPQLQKIEFAYERYQASWELQQLLDDVLPEEAYRNTRETEELNAILCELVEALDEELCFWHYPFYKGKFSSLIKAFSQAGKPVSMEATDMVRNRFRQFVRTAPDLQLGSMPQAMKNDQARHRSIGLLRQLATQKLQLANLVSSN